MPKSSLLMCVFELAICQCQGAGLSRGESLTSRKIPSTPSWNPKNAGRSGKLQWTSQHWCFLNQYAGSQMQSVLLRRVQCAFLFEMGGMRELYSAWTISWATFHLSQLEEWGGYTMTICKSEHLFGVHRDFQFASWIKFSCQAAGADGDSQLPAWFPLTLPPHSPVDHKRFGYSPNA